jgi:exportin-2 (importin alpha re-exporter)
MFEDSPQDYIRFDLESANPDTRREASCELVRALCILHESQITALLGSYVMAMLSSGAQQQSKGWRERDTAIFLMGAVAVKTRTDSVRLFF